MRKKRTPLQFGAKIQHQGPFVNSFNPFLDFKGSELVVESPLDELDGLD